MLIENPGHGGSLNHLGVEVADTDDRRRRADAGWPRSGLASVDERDTTCCYAKQDKFWVEGAPNGEQWEIYTVLEDAGGPTAPVYPDDHTMSSRRPAPALPAAPSSPTGQLWRTQKHAERALMYMAVCQRFARSTSYSVRRSARSADCQRRPIPARWQQTGTDHRERREADQHGDRGDLRQVPGHEHQAGEAGDEDREVPPGQDSGAGQTDEQQDRADQREHLEAVPEEQQRGVLEAAEHLGGLLDRQVLRGRRGSTSR